MAKLVTIERQNKIGVVVPAHNEEAVIQRCLDCLLADATEGEFEVAVVANGCDDRTAEFARGYGSPVQVIEMPVGSKVGALNKGDAALSPSSFPRIYLDGDLELSTQAARAICEAVDLPGILAAAPEFEFDTNQSTTAVRMFYRAWRAMPYLNNGRIAGAYALSLEGRSRFGCFPDVLSDDGYARLQFGVDERKTIKSCCVVVRAPGTLGDLVRIKTRSRLGTIQLKARYPDLFRNETSSESASIRSMIARPTLALEFLVYVAINAITRFRARAQYRKGFLGWERDQSSRSPSAARLE